MGAATRNHRPFSTSWADLDGARRTIDGSRFQIVIAHEFDHERRYAMFDGDQNHSASRARKRDIEQAALFSMRVVIAFRHCQQEHGIVLPRRRERSATRSYTRKHHIVGLQSL